MEDRRKFERYNIDEKVILKPKDNSSRTIEVELADLSLIGIGVFTQEKLSIGTEIEFTIISKALNKEISGTGRIKYALEIRNSNKAPVRMGVEFNKIDSDAMQSIVNYIRDMKP